jgi:hypothetical protein
VLPCPQAAGTGKPESLQAVQGLHQGAAVIARVICCCLKSSRNAQQCTAMHSNAQQCTAMHSNAQQCTAMHSKVTKTEDFEKSHANKLDFFEFFTSLVVLDLYYRVSVVNV